MKNLLYRPSEGYSDNFDSIRITTVKSKIFDTITYTDLVGANAADKQFAQEHKGFTLPKGKYNLTSAGLKKNDDGTYNSGHFYDTLRLITNDINIDSNI